MDKLAEAKKIFNIEIEAIEKTRDILDNKFLEILDTITNCKGKVILTGMGKPGHIAKKIAATMSSLGTPAFFLHPAEALHGDLGMVSENDVVIAISYSGESEEVTRLIPNIKFIGAKLIAISGNENSTLVKNSDIFQILPKFNEACYLGLAPTSSTTAVLCYGDALAVVASSIYGFKDIDFGKYHPAGSLGKKLFIKIDDLMISGEDNSVVHIKSTLKEAIVELSKKGLGIVTVIDDNNSILGVITDGDLRRQLEKGVDVYSLKVEEVMTKTPTFIHEGYMAVDALKVLKERNLSSMPVINKNNKLIGTIRLQSIINAGII